jgi:hypothetical protein
MTALFVPEVHAQKFAPICTTGCLSEWTHRRSGDAGEVRVMRLQLRGVLGASENM